MTDDTHHVDDTEDRSDNHHQTVEACQYAADAAMATPPTHARTLLDEARTLVRAIVL